MKCKQCGAPYPTEMSHKCAYCQCYRPSSAPEIKAGFAMAVENPSQAAQQQAQYLASAQQQAMAQNQITAIFGLKSYGANSHGFLGGIF